jgi:hypothetical protein
VNVGRINTSAIDKEGRVSAKEAVSVALNSDVCKPEQAPSHVDKMAGSEDGKGVGTRIDVGYDHWPREVPWSIKRLWQRQHALQRLQGYTWCERLAAVALHSQKGLVTHAQ